jgi:hypothetical protein
MIESALADGLIARAARPDYPRFEAQLRSSATARVRSTCASARITAENDGRRAAGLSGLGIVAAVELGDHTGAAQLTRAKLLGWIGERA